MASGNDMNAHASTYTGFVGMMKYGSVVTVLITAFVIYMIAK